MATGVRRRPDGKWDAWVKVNGRVSWGRGHRTQAEAVAWRNERVRLREQHVELLPARITVAELVRRHFELYGEHLKPSTRARYMEILEAYVVPDPIGKRRARDVRPSDVQAFVNRVTATRSAASAEKAYGLLRSAFRKAVENDELPKSPARGIVFREHEVALDVPTLRETEELVAAVRPEFRDAVALVSLTGLRRGEVVALRWSAVNFNRRELSVRATAAWIAAELVGDEREDGRRNVLHEGSPKSKAGRRTLALLDRAVELLRAVRREQLERARELGAAYDNAGGYVFTRPDGRPLDPNALSRAVMEASRRLGRRYRLHDVRHAFVVRAVEAGIPAPIIAGAVGHSDPSFTVARYFHGTGEQQRAAASRLQSYLGAEVVGGLAATHESGDESEAAGGSVEPLVRGE